MSIYFVFALSFIIFVIVIAARLLFSLFSLNLGAQPFAVGALAATFSIFPMLLSVPAGKITDRFGPRWPLLLGTIGVACGMLIPYFDPGLPALYAGAALNGLSFAFFFVTLQNLVGIMSNSNNRTQNFKNFALVGSVVNFVSPMMVGFSIDHSGHVNVCLYLALLSLVPLMMLAVWGAALPGGNRNAAKSTGSILKTIADPGVWRVLVTSSLLMSGIDLFQFYMPVYGHSIGLSATAIGVVLGMFAAAAFMVRLVLTRLIAWLDEEKDLAIAFFLGAVSFMLVPFSNSVVILALLAFVFGLGIGCGGPIVTLLTFSNSEPGRSGEALGLRMTVNHLTRVVSPVAFGAIGSAFGLFPVFWLNALMLGCGGMLSRSKKTG